MKLKELIEECNESIYNAACERESTDDSFCCATVSLNDGYVEIGAERDDETITVSVYHDDEENKRELCNMESFLEQNISVDWDAADRYVEEQIEGYDEWNEHGFADASDYYRWRYGK